MMNKSLSTCALYFIFIAYSAISIAQAPPKKPSSSSKDGVEGLLVNSTISVNGMVFFLNFLDFWREKPGSDTYTMEIAESASKRLGNQVWVSFGQKRLFYSALPVQREKIRTLSEQAVETSYAALIALALPINVAVDPDIGNDEF
jgi:hypothetical protein